MNKILAFCALALSAGYVQAQTTAGRMLIGGNVGYTSQKNESSLGDTKVTSFNVNPQFGYFVADHLAVGLYVGYYNQNVNYPDPFTGDGEFESKYYSTSLLPFVRYYIFTPNEKFAFYAEARTGIGFTRTDYEAVDEKIKGRYFSAQLAPGFSYFFNEKWALDLQLGGISYYSSNSNIDSDAENKKGSAFNIEASLTPALGFRYFMGQ
ncbi:outer membrane beta-barrel protein [Fulvivirgaceae bacterium PWU5]|uniref:Outer membrane beta-barrel protein n=1 Tax=Dawidia cretensis TaxID=2782350 RepID=A0AAP2DW91_9BACT|nr:outer membrane beta-barrel protein [Dawidia cretensis]MBT1708520.1 outer membrane beta-barrel protein [Dawidia cretensis]